MANYKQPIMPRVNVPSLSFPKLKVPKATVPKLSLPHSFKSQSEKTKRHVADLGDLILGNPIAGTRQLKDTLKDYDLEELTYIPIVNRIVGLGLMANERFLEPVFKDGEVGKALINTLETFGNSLDIVANPVKSLLPVAGGGTYEDFLKSMGWDDSAYRELYQWDTGNMAIDFIGEVVSDPLNWVSIGGKALAKGATDAVKEAVTTTLIKKTTKETVESLSKQTVDEFVELIGKTADVNSPAIKHMLDDIGQARRTLSAKLRTVDKYSDTYKMYKNQLDNIKVLNNAKDIQNLLDSVQSISTTKYYNYYKTMKNITSFSDDLDKTILKTSAWITPIGPAFYSGKLLVTKGFPHLLTKAHLQMTDLLNKNPFNNAPALVKHVDDVIVPYTKSLHKGTLTTFEELFQKYNLDVKQLHKMWMNLYYKSGVVSDVDRKFLDKLYKLVPELKYVMDKGGAIYGVRPDDIRDLQAIIEEMGLMTINSVETSMAYSKQTAKNIVKQVDELDISTELNNVNTVIKSYTDIIRRKGDTDLFKNVEFRAYLKEHGINPKYPFDLRNVYSFIDYIKEMYPTQADNLTRSLDVLGITPDNAPKIQSLLDAYKAGDKQALDRIKDLIKKARLGDISTAKELKVAVKQTSAVTDAKGLQKALSQIKKQVKDKTGIERFFNEHSINYEDVISTSEQINQFATQARDLTKDLNAWKNALFTVDADEDALSKFYADLDQFLYYVGAAEEDAPSVILGNVLDFNPNFDELTNLTEYLENVEELQLTVKRWRSTIKNMKRDDIKKNYNLVKTIQDLDFILSKQRNIMDLTEFYKAVADGEQYYMLIMSAQERFYYAQRALYNSLGPNSDWFLELGQSDSTLRANLNYVINILREQQGDSARVYSDKFAKILTAIDTSTNIEMAMADMETILKAYDFTADQNRYLTNAIFDTIYFYKNKYPVEILLNNPRQLTDKYMSQVYKALPNLDLTPKVEGANELVNEFLDLKDKLQTIGLTDSEYDRYDELNILLSEAEIFGDTPVPKVDLRNLETDVSSVFKTYLENQIKISTQYNTDVLVFNTLDSSAINAMQELGADYEDIIDVLTNARVSYKDINTVIGFIQRVSSEVSGDTIESVQRKLNNYLDVIGESANFVKLMDTLNEEVIKEYTVADVLATAYRDVGIINKELIGDTGEAVGSVATIAGQNKTLNAAVKFVKKADFDAYIRETTGMANAYDFTIYNGMYSVRKLVDTTFNYTHKLDPKYIKTGPEYYTLVQNMKIERRFVDMQGIHNIQDIDRKRKALIKFYSNSSVNYGPKNPATYFYDIDPYDVIAWFRLSSKRKFGKQNAELFLQCTKEYGINLDEKINGILNDLDVMYDTTLIGEDSFYVDILNRLDYANLPIAREAAIMDFEKWIKDPYTLQKNQDLMLKWIDEDVSAIQKLGDLDAINKTTQRVSDVISKATYDKYHDVFKQFHIGYNDHISSANVLRLLKAERMETVLYNVRNFTPRQLRTWVDREAGGAVIVVGLHKSLLKHSTEDLAKVGLMINNLEEAPDLWFIRSLGTEYTPEDYVYKIPKSLFPKQQDIITNVLKSNRNYIEYDGITLPDELWTGDMMDKTVYDAIMSDSLIRKGFDVERFPLSFKNKDGLNNFYKKEISRPNLFIIGNLNGYNTVLDYCTEALEARGLTKLYNSADIVKSVYRGTISAVKRVNKEHKYLQLFFNNDFYIGNPTFSKVLTGASDEELQQLFKRNNFVAAILKQDSKGRPIVYKISINNQSQLADAIASNAIIVPNEIYKNMVLTINQHRLESKILNLYMRTITSTFKTIYLTSVGYLMRNAADSLIYKNAATTDGALGILENFKYEYRAMRMMKMYEDIQREAMSMLADNNNKFNRYLINKVLLTKDPEIQAMYKLVDLYISSGASAGLTKTLQDYLINYNVGTKGVSGFWFEKYWNESLAKLPPMKQIQDYSTMIEHTSRLGLFLRLVDEGEDYTSAIRKVVDTHFNYEVKEPGMELIEQIFWFATFPINNFMFYVNEGITKNPDLLKMQMDALELSYNNNSLTWEDVRNSNYLTYNALAGNLRVYWGEHDNIIIKTGSSVMDFFNVLLTPIGEAKERMNPFLSVLFGIDEPDQLNPFNSITNKVEQIKEGRSYLPSVYATLYKQQPYRRRYYMRNYNTRTWVKYPRRHYYKKPSNNDLVMSRFLGKSFYFNHRRGGQYWVKSNYTYNPDWYKYSSEFKRTRRSYNRKLKSYYKTR